MTTGENKQLDDLRGRVEEQARQIAVLQEASRRSEDTQRSSVATLEVIKENVTGMRSDFQHFTSTIHQHTGGIDALESRANEAEKRISALERDQTRQDGESKERLAGVRWLVGIAITIAAIGVSVLNIVLTHGRK